MLSTSFSAGVDLATVSGRLGHGGGGATTLRVYAAWVVASDQRAADILAAKMPTRPRERPSRIAASDSSTELRVETLPGTP